jgi:hypothetical protein
VVAADASGGFRRCAACSGSARRAGLWCGFVSLLLPIYLVEFGFSALAIGAIVTSALIGTALLTLWVGWIANRHSRRLLLLAAAVLMAATGAGCWAHVRRKFFDVHAATASPIAKEALDRIGQLYAVEKVINGSPPERRRQQRQLQSRPIAEALAGWADKHGAPALAQIRARSGLPLYAGALDCPRSLLR